MLKVEKPGKDIETELRFKALGITRIILASASENRRMTLEGLGLEVVSRPQDILEIAGKMPPRETVEKLSRMKEESYVSSPLFEKDEISIAADTLVCLDGELIGKPKDGHEAKMMLKMFSGRAHEVYSGISIWMGNGIVTTSDVSVVRFKSLSDEEMDEYVLTGDWKGAAGGYRIQRNGNRLIESIEGSFYNVIGIPIEKMLSILSSEAR